MNQLIRSFFMGMAMLCMWSCQVEPEAIRFGEDQCDECKMTISDHRFGAEVVTKKGKIKKFDSVECLLDHLKINDAEDLAHILVIDYSNPKALINAKDAKYLISKKIPSPMGGFLSAYASLDYDDVVDGELHNWVNLNRRMIKR